MRAAWTASSSTPGTYASGQWDPNATPRFTPTLNQPDAVSVTVRREGGTNGPISTIFARVLGVNTFDVQADATAALTASFYRRRG